MTSSPGMKARGTAFTATSLYTFGAPQAKKPTQTSEWSVHVMGKSDQLKSE